MKDRETGSPHLSPQETARLIRSAASEDERARREAMTRLAWRPAWSIRSRRGAFAALIAALRGER